MYVCVHTYIPNCTCSSLYLYNLLTSCKQKQPLKPYRRSGFSKGLRLARGGERKGQIFLSPCTLSGPHSPPTLLPLLPHSKPVSPVTHPERMLGSETSGLKFPNPFREALALTSNLPSPWPNYFSVKHDQLVPCFPGTHFPCKHLAIKRGQALCDDSKPKGSGLRVLFVLDT